MKEQCKNSRLPHLLMIVAHEETLFSPAPQLMDDDYDDEYTNDIWKYIGIVDGIINTWRVAKGTQ